MNNPIRGWRERARRRDAEQTPARPPAPGRGRHAGVAADAMRQIETEAPLDKPPAGPVAPRHVYSAAGVRWLWAQFDRNNEQAKTLEDQAFESLELAKALRDRNVDIKHWLGQADAVGVVHVQDEPAPAPAVQPAPGACVECGAAEVTVLHMNYQTRRLEPLCPKCDAFYTNAANQVAKDTAAAPAPSQPPAAVVTGTGSPGPGRPVLDPALDDVRELEALDGAR